MQPEKQYEFSAVLSPDLIREIGTDLQAVYPDFEVVGFCEAIVPALEGRLIKARAQLVADQLHQYLPPDRAIDLLTAALSPKLGTSADSTSPFKYLPYGTYVSQHGLAPEQFEAATRFLYEMTQRFSAEFAIRPFLMRYPERMLPLLRAWAQAPNQHVRRLVSEGSRPRLPWAKRVTAYDADYAPILALLKQLHNDPELYVRRSVANHLNDLTKDRPALVLTALEAWQQQLPSTHLTWVTKHALRSLIKAGDAHALALIGFAPDPALRVQHFGVALPRLALGQQQVLTLQLVSTSTEAQPLLIDYVVFFKKANGQLRPKVFKWTTHTLAAGAQLVVEKKHLFKVLSTRRMYPGEHRLAPQVNGRVLETTSFELIFPI